MNWLIVGNGIQGKKREKILGSRCVGVLDPFDKTANFSRISEISHPYDIVCICTNQDAKKQLLHQFLELGKSILIEKPFPSMSASDFNSINNLALEKGNVVYTAYNHRFEPSIVSLANIVSENSLGKFYFGRFTYGNGTVKEIAQSSWKASPSGLLFDLGSHMIDIYHFIFNRFPSDIKTVQRINIESSFESHMIMTNNQLIIELSYCNWKSKFEIELYFQFGSLHLKGLQKWGGSKLEIHTRVFPSGEPKIEVKTFYGPDLTWDSEHHFMESLIERGVHGIYGTPEKVNTSLEQIVVA